MNLSRKKISNKDKWSLSVDGENIGVAEATYKTATQRSWNAVITVKGDTFVSKDKFSIKQAMLDLEAQLG